MKKEFLKYLTLILLIALIIFIFARSLQPGDKSKEESENVGAFLNAILDFFNINTEFGQFFVRKLAHFTEYLLLGALAYLTAIQFSLPKSILISGAFSLFIGSFDEAIQLFVPGRDGKIPDVLLDFSGAVCGITFTFLIIYFFAKKKEKKQKNS